MATSADWNMWLGQGQNRQADPLAPLNQQFGGSQGAYIPTGANTPTSSAYMADPYRMALAGAPAQGQGQTSIADDWNKWRTEPITPTIPQQASFGSMGQQQGQGESMGGGQDWSYAKAAQEPQLVNPKTGGAGGTPTATGWTDTSVPDLTLQSDNAANKPKGPGATGVFANDQWVNEAGNRFDYGDATQAPGRARAGTALAKGAVKTWVNYDGSRDTQLHDYNGIDQETSWRRVNRWTQEGVAEHGLTPQEAHNAALARLKRDFELTNLDWRNSGFDLSNVQSAAPGQDWAKANAVGATPPPVVTPGVVPKIADSNVPGFVPSTKAPTPQQPGIDPKTGLPQATAPQTGDPNQPFLDEASIDMVRSNAEQALSAIRGLRGGRDKTGPLGAYREQTLSRALQAYLSMNAGGNMSDPMSYANGGAGELINRLNSGQGIGNFLRENAGNMMDGLDYSNLDSGQIMDYLNLAGGAATFGYSPMGKYGMENTLADLQDQANIQSQRGINPTQSVLATSQGRGQFDDLLARFLALQQGR